MFSNTSLQILFLPKLSSLGADCHASLPSVDNRSLSEEPSVGTRAQGSALLLADDKTQIFTALNISYLR